MATEQEQVQPKPLPDFGAPLKDVLLQGLASVGARDLASASQWWDEIASPEWQGALDSKPIGAKRKK
jgi:hypothetical protein